MIGTQVGKWYVIEEIKVEQKRSAVFRHYNCRCACGIIKIVRADGLRNGKSSQCEECRKKERYINTESMVGNKYGEWTVLEALTNKTGQRTLRCKCKCGRERILTASILKLGKNNQCHLCNVTKHGYEGTPTYNTWRCMLARCNSSKNHNFNLYGGRGIKVCERWFKFENFLEDMGEKPLGLQLDRTDNNGNYEPGNCKWVTPKENSNNRRKRPVVWNLKK
jgi:hypothetical protein